MIYTAYCGHSLTCQNNLEKAIHEYLKEIDRLAVSDQEVEAFKKEISDYIEKLNKDFPRCKPVKPSWWSHDKDMTIHLYGSGIKDTFYLIAAKEDRLVI